MKPETQAAGCRTSPPLCSVRTDLEIIKDKLMSLIELHLPEDLTDLIDSAEWEVQTAIRWVDEHAPNNSISDTDIGFLCDDEDISPAQIRAELEADGVDVEAFLNRIRETIEQAKPDLPAPAGTCPECGSVTRGGWCVLCGDTQNAEHHPRAVASRGGCSCSAFDGGQQ